MCHIWSAVERLIASTTKKSHNISLFCEYLLCINTNIYACKQKSFDSTNK